MAASSGHTCGPCDTKHVTTVALVWCTSCNEGLCTTCSEHHTASKASRQHQTIPVSQYITLEPFLSSVKQECDSHSRHFDFYCLDHNTPCCASCLLVQHSKCNKVKPIDELSQQAKQSGALPDIERGLKDLQKSITEIKSNQHKNLDDIEKQRLNIMDDIKAIKLKFNNYLDRLESEVLNELAETSKKEKAQMDGLLEELEEKEKCIQVLLTTINQINILPDIQIFLASLELEIRVSQEEKWATDVCCKKAMETNINFSTENKLEQLMTEIKTFGKVQITHSPIQVKVGAWKQQQAQISVHTDTNRQIEDIRLQLVRQIEFGGSVDIKDCCTLPDGKMVFAHCIGDKLLVYNEDGEIFKEISTGRGPYGLTVIDSDTVAVSCRSSKIVQIIDVTTSVFKHTINVNGICHGLSYNKGKLYVLVQGRGIMECDVDGNVIRTIPVDVLTDDGYLYCCSNGFCFTCCPFSGSGFIAYYDDNGKELWKSDIGDSGVTVDNNGNTYVTSYNNHLLSVVSADGKKNKNLLSKDDELYKPEGVYYNKEKNTLLVVTSYDGKAALYRVL